MEKINFQIAFQVKQLFWGDSGASELCTNRALSLTQYSFRIVCHRIIYFLNSRVAIYVISQQECVYIACSTSRTIEVLRIIMISTWTQISPKTYLLDLVVHIIKFQFSHFGQSGAATTYVKKQCNTNITVIAIHSNSSLNTSSNCLAILP